MGRGDRFGSLITLESKSSSLGRLLARGPHQNRIRRFPRSGSSADVPRGYPRLAARAPRLQPELEHRRRPPQARRRRAHRRRQRRARRRAVWRRCSTRGVARQHGHVDWLRFHAWSRRLSAAPWPLRLSACPMRSSLGLSLRRRFHPVMAR